jgi:hypothetical protein
VLTLIFPLKVKMPFSRRFSYVLLQSFRIRFTIAVISSAAVAERRPCTAQRSGGGAHHSRDLLKRGRFFIMH